MDQELTEEELQDLYAWLDKIPLSRPKRHITRDFSDGGRKANLLGWLAEGAKPALLFTSPHDDSFGSKLRVGALCCDLTASLLNPV